MKPVSFFALAACLSCTCGATSCFAQSTVFLNYANVVATGSTIALTRLPIRLPNGTIIYKDAIIALKADANGVLTINPATPAQAPSPALLTANFRAGTYVYPQATSEGFVLSGPSVVTGSSDTKWSVEKATNLNREYCGTPATFYVGPIASNPYHARLMAAGITSAEYSYGIMGSDSSCGPYYNTNAIVGFSQSGNLLSIASFTDGTGKDYNVPRMTYTYQLQ